MDYILKRDYETKDEAKELVEKLKESAYKIYTEQIYSFEKKLNEHELAKIECERKSEEAMNNYTNRFKQLQEEINQN